MRHNIMLTNKIPSIKHFVHLLTTLKDAHFIHADTISSLYQLTDLVSVPMCIC